MLYFLAILALIVVTQAATLGDDLIHRLDLSHLRALSHRLDLSHLRALSHRLDLSLLRALSHRLDLSHLRALSHRLDLDLGSFGMVLSLKVIIRAHLLLLSLFPQFWTFL